MKLHSTSLGLVFLDLFVAVQARPRWLQKRHEVAELALGPRDYSVYETATAAYGYTYGGYGPAPTVSVSSSSATSQTTLEVSGHVKSTTLVSETLAESMPPSESISLSSATTSSDVSTIVYASPSSILAPSSSVVATTYPANISTSEALSYSASLSSSIPETSVPSDTTGIGIGTSPYSFASRTSLGETTSSAIGIATSLSASSAPAVYETSSRLEEATSSTIGVATFPISAAGFVYTASSSQFSNSSQTVAHPSEITIRGTTTFSILYTLSVPTSSATAPTICHRNNCLRQILRFSTAAATFCATYTTTISTITSGLPNYVSNCKNSPSSISSACSCLNILTPTYGGTITGTAPTGLPSKSSAQTSFTTPIYSSAAVPYPSSNTSAYLHSESGVATPSAIGITAVRSSSSYYTSAYSFPHPVLNVTFGGPTGTSSPRYSTAVPSSLSWYSETVPILPSTSLSPYQANSSSAYTASTGTSPAITTRVTSIITITVPVSAETSSTPPTSSEIYFQITTSRIGGIDFSITSTPYPLHNSTHLPSGYSYSLNSSSEVSVSTYQSSSTGIVSSHDIPSSSSVSPRTGNPPSIYNTNSAPYLISNASSLYRHTATGATYVASVSEKLTTSSAIGIFTSKPPLSTVSFLRQTYSLSSIVGPTYTSGIPSVSSYFSAGSLSTGVSTSSTIGIFEESSAPYAWPSNYTSPAEPSGTGSYLLPVRSGSSTSSASGFIGSISVVIGASSYSPSATSNSISSIVSSPAYPSLITSWSSSLSVIGSLSYSSVSSSPTSIETSTVKGETGSTSSKFSSMSTQYTIDYDSYLPTSSPEMTFLAPTSSIPVTLKSSKKGTIRSTSSFVLSTLITYTASPPTISSSSIGNFSISLPISSSSSGATTSDNLGFVTSLSSSSLSKSSSTPLIESSSSYATPPTYEYGSITAPTSTSALPPYYKSPPKARRVFGLL